MASQQLTQNHAAVETVGRIGAKEGEGESVGNKDMAIIFQDTQGVIDNDPLKEKNNQWPKLCHLTEPIQRQFEEQRIDINHEESIIPPKQCN